MKVAADYPRVAYWLAAGVPSNGAIALADAGILSIAHLSGRTQAELVAIPGFGRSSLRACEKLLGHPLPPRHLEPAVAFWREQGFTNAAAVALSRAGIHSIEDLARRDRDSLESLHWIGRTELRRCEALLGRPLPAKRDYWTERGLSPRIASCLIAAGVATLEDFARLTREEFLLRKGLARTALEKCEELLGRRLPSPAEEWRRRGCKTRSLARKLTQAGILTEDDLRRKTREELAAAGLDPGEIAFCRRLVRPKRKARGGRPASQGGVPDAGAAAPPR